MPKQINTYKVGQALVRRFNLKGRFQPVLDETVVPVAVVDEGVEDRAAWGGQARAASGPGNQNRVFLQNPAASLVDLHVDYIWVEGLVADVAEVEIIKGIGTTSGGGIWRDSRVAGVPTGLVAGSASGSVVLGMPQFTIGAHGTTPPVAIEVGAIIPPGWRIVVRQEQANDDFWVIFAWRERDIVQEA